MEMFRYAQHDKGIIVIWRCFATLNMTGKLLVILREFYRHLWIIEQYNQRFPLEACGNDKIENCFAQHDKFARHSEELADEESQIGDVSLRST